MSIYCIINSDDYVINKIYYDATTTVECPHPAYPDCQVILSTGAEQIGWKYVDGAFVAPPIDPASPPPPPLIVPQDTASGNARGIYSQASPETDPTLVATLQAQVQSLTASLAQVMSTLNTITVPNA
jgi:hypothetical protein